MRSLLQEQVSDEIELKHDYITFEWLLRFMIKFEDVKQKCKMLINKNSNYDSIDAMHTPLKSYLDKFDHFNTP